MQPEVHFLPDNKRIRIRPGTTLLAAGKAARVGIRTSCGGKAACLMCKVIVVEQSGLDPLNRNEEIKLGFLTSNHYRLSCQAKVRGNVTVQVPEDPLKAAVRRQLARLTEDE